MSYDYLKDNWRPPIIVHFMYWLNELKQITEMFMENFYSSHEQHPDTYNLNAPPWHVQLKCPTLDTLTKLLFLPWATPWHVQLAPPWWHHEQHPDTYNLPHPDDTWTTDWVIYILRLEVNDSWSKLKKSLKIALYMMYVNTYTLRSNSKSEKLTRRCEKYTDDGHPMFITCCSLI